MNHKFFYMEESYEKVKKYSIAGSHDSCCGFINILRHRFKCYKTFEKEQNGIKTTVTFTYIEKEDKVIKQKNEVVGEYAKLPEKKTKEQVKSILDPIVKKYQGIKGIKYTVDYKDDRYIENIEIDFQNLDYEKAKTVFGNNFKDPSKTKISMKQTQERVAKQGFKERK